jgi:uncharacterized protein (DUF488 family)
MTESAVFTIGHSTHSLEVFLELLNRHTITAIADVRSSPFSRRSPHFNRRELERSLKQEGIEYRFLGNALGGRPKDPKLYVRGTADYEAMAQTEIFKEGLERVLKGTQKHRLALMCSEQDPIDCHRCLLIGRALSESQVTVVHVIPGAAIQSQRDIEERLLNINRQVNRDLFVPADVQLQAAYRGQGMRVAFSEKSCANRPAWEVGDVEYY